MKISKTDLWIVIGLVVLAAVIFFSVGPEPIYVQLHDTYIAFDQVWLTILIIGPLTFFVFLFRAVSERFRNWVANVGLIIGLIAVVGIVYHTVWLAKQLG